VIKEHASSAMDAQGFGLEEIRKRFGRDQEEIRKRSGRGLEETKKRLGRGLEGVSLC